MSTVDPYLAPAYATERLLFLERFSGVGENPFVPSQSDSRWRGETEFVRRREALAAGPAVKPSAFITRPGSQPGGGGNPTPTIFPDRLHKNWAFFVFVARDHLQTGADVDPVLNPAFKPATATASSIGAAYAYAIANYVPLLIGNERIRICILGGQYTETLLLTSDKIDFVGIGEPLILGQITIDTTCTTVQMENIRNVVSGTNACTVNAGADPGGVAPPIELINCKFESSDKHGIVHLRRIKATGCEFTTGDATLNFYPQQAVYSGWPSFSWFKDCKFYGHRDFNNRPDSFSCQITSLIGGGIYADNTVTANTGVQYVNCEHYGTIINDCWRLVVQGGYQFGGFLVPATQANMILLARCASQMTPVNSISEFNGCPRASGGVFIVAADFVPAALTAFNYAWVRDCKQLLANSFISLGQSFTQIPIPNIGNLTVYDVDFHTHNATDGGGAVVTFPTDVFTNIGAPTFIDMYDNFIE
jgi:hypothetical protein